MAEFRQSKDSDLWHFCTNCSEWPTHDYISSETRPVSGKIDFECCAKADYAECRESIWGSARPKRSGRVSRTGHPRRRRVRSRRQHI